MPGGDRSGPRGEGPRTGRAAGYCSGYDVPGYMNPAGRYGGGGFYGAGGPRGGGFFGGGYGRGRRNRFFATGLPLWSRGGIGYRQFYPYGYDGYEADYPRAESAGDELDYLRQEAEFIEKRLGSISGRISELEADAKKETD